MTYKKEPRHGEPGRSQITVSTEDSIPQADPPSLQTAALRYANLGWSVFPLRPRTKKPATPHGFKDATTDADRIHRWWETHPHHNVAVATGPESGIWVLDVDAKSGGGRTLEMLLEEHGPLPDTPRADTGGGGQHFVFAYPTDGCVIKNDTGKVGQGVDVRGDGGYIVASPSVHPNGQPYVWDQDDHPLKIAPAQAPEWLLSLVAESGNDSHQRMTSDEWRPFADPPETGARNESLMKVAGKLIHALCVKSI